MLKKIFITSALLSSLASAQTLTIKLDESLNKLNILNVKPYGAQGSLAASMISQNGRKEIKPGETDVWNTCRTSDACYAKGYVSVFGLNDWVPGAKPYSYTEKCKKYLDKDAAINFSDFAAFDLTLTIFENQDQIDCDMVFN